VFIQYPSVKFFDYVSYSDLYVRAYFNPYAANVENMVSSSKCQQMADGI
jgi:hypothetical protein